MVNLSQVLKKKLMDNACLVFVNLTRKKKILFNVVFWSRCIWVSKNNINCAKNCIVKLNVVFNFLRGEFTMSIVSTFFADNQLWFWSQKVPQMPKTPTTLKSISFSTSAYNLDTFRVFRRIIKYHPPCKSRDFSQQMAIISSISSTF